MKVEQAHNNVQWKKVKLGEVCVPSSEKYNPLTENLFQYCIEMENINQESGTLNGKSDIAKLLSLKTKFHKGEVLYGKLRPYLRKYWLADFDGACSTEIWVLKNAENIDNRFLFYLFQSESINKIANLSSGTKMPRADWKFMEKQEISIPFKNGKPDIPAQRRIAAILSSADKVIALTQKVIAKYKQMKQGLMEDLLKPKEGWKMVRLGEVGEIITGLTYSPSNVRQEGVLVLRSSNIQDDNLCFEDNVYVDVEGFNPVIENDVLICVRNGSRALIGKTARITKEVEGCAFGAFMLIYRSCYNDFLYHFFKSDMFFSQVSRNIGATINSINGSDLKNMEVYMPSDPTKQRRIATVLSGIDAKIIAEQAILNKYTLIKKGLMEKLLNEKK